MTTDYKIPILNNGSFNASQTVLTDADKKLVTADYLNQAVKTTSSPTFSKLTVGNASTYNPITLSRYADSPYCNGFLMLKARGSYASPAGVVANDQLFRMSTQGCQSNGAFPSSSSSDDVVLGSATETWTTIAHGRKTTFLTIANGATTATARMTIDQNGYIGIGVTTPLDLLHVQGNSRATLFRAVDQSTLASNSLNNGSLTGGTSWTATNDCALSSNAANWSYTTGLESTLTQASDTMTTAGKPNRYYKLTYTVTNSTGSPTAAITTSFAATTTSLAVSTNGSALVVYFISAASPSDFVISATLTTGQAFTLDTLSLQEIIGGDVRAYGLFTGGGTEGIKVMGDGKVGIGNSAPNEVLEVTGKIRASTGFNVNGTDGVTQAAAAGKVCDVTALAGGIATAQTQITYAADGTYDFEAPSSPDKVRSITIANGRITSITTT